MKKIPALILFSAAVCMFLIVQPKNAYTLPNSNLKFNLDTIPKKINPDKLDTRDSMKNSLSKGYNGTRDSMLKINQSQPVIKKNKKKYTTIKKAVDSTNYQKK